VFAVRVETPPDAVNSAGPGLFAEERVVALLDMSNAQV
jgi:hypothetical protein